MLALNWMQCAAPRCQRRMDRRAGRRAGRQAGGRVGVSTAMEAAARSVRQADPQKDLLRLPRHGAVVSARGPRPSCRLPFPLIRLCVHCSNMKRCFVRCSLWLFVVRCSLFVVRCRCCSLWLWCVPQCWLCLDGFKKSAAGKEARCPLRYLCMSTMKLVAMIAKFRHVLGSSCPQQTNKKQRKKKKTKEQKSRILIFCTTNTTVTREISSFAGCVCVCVWECG